MPDIQKVPLVKQAVKLVKKKKSYDLSDEDCHQSEEDKPSKKNVSATKPVSMICEVEAKNLPLKTTKIKNMFNSITSLHKIIQVSTRDQLEGMLKNSARGQSSNSESTGPAPKDDRSLSHGVKDSNPRFESP